jgi:hypothetical protein
VDFTNQLDGVVQNRVFGLVVQLPPAPVIQSVRYSAGTVSLTWSAVDGLSYQLQYTAHLPASNWQSLGGVLTATNTTEAATDTPGTDMHRFYRVVVVP